jgi:hypothetical protein
MRRFIRNLIGAVAVVAMVILLFMWDSSGWWPIPSIRGQHDARVDVAHGNYKVLTYGIADPSRSEYSTQLRQRYSVELHAVAGCTVSKSLVDYVAAYNEVSIAAVKNKFGRDIFKETYDEAVKNWKLAHPENAAN